MQLSPIERYQKDLLKPSFRPDKAQEEAVEHLQSLYDLLTEDWKTEQAQSFFSRLLGGVGLIAKEPRKGLYFWGGVGRGKTYLMDAFYEALPFEQKMRTHFHRFMRRVHLELKLLTDQADPLPIVAKKLANEARVICFDEFFVSDITDAMILAGLLDSLFKNGVVLVATSNIEPDGLYKDGLQRARFLPAIDLLNQYVSVVNVDGGVDYRLRTLEKTALFYNPVNPESHAALKRCFSDLAPDAHAIVDNPVIRVEGRDIRAVKEADDIVWFHFRSVCDGPRSQNDYIELAREYHAVIIEGVPAFSDKNDDMAKRFIYLVDELYDRNVKLILSCEKPMVAMYGEGRLAFEFQRTFSRLQEMQSKEYLSRPHSPS